MAQLSPTFMELKETCPSKVNGKITPYICGELGAKSGKESISPFVIYTAAKFSLGGALLGCSVILGKAIACYCEVGRTKMGWLSTRTSILPTCTHREIILRKTSFHTWNQMQHRQVCSEQKEVCISGLWYVYLLESDLYARVHMGIV